MRLGLVVSSVLHAALLLWALVSVHVTTPLNLPKDDPIAVDTITPSELTQLRQGSRTAKLEDAEAQEAPKPSDAQKQPPKPKPKPVATPPPPAAEPPPATAEKEPTPPEPPKVEPPPPEKVEAAKPPEPDKEAMEKKLEELAMQQAADEAAAKQKAEAEAKAKAKAEAEAKAKAIAKAKAEAKAKAIAKAKAEAKAKADAEAKSREKSKSVVASAKALLDKSPDESAPAANAAPPEKPTKAKGPVKGAAEGRDRINSASEEQMLLGKIRSRISQCWNIQAGMEGAAALIPVVEFQLNRDGSVRGMPRVVNNQPSPAFQSAADAALRAVIECQNYDLPAEKYDMWEIVRVRFDPSQMF